MEKIELDEKAVAYEYVGKSISTGKVESEGIALAKDIMKLHRSLTAEFLEVELTPLYELPEGFES
jgi:hypothetical protein